MSNYTSKPNHAQSIDILKFMVQKIDTTYKVFNPAILERPDDLFNSLLIKTLNHFVAGNEIGGPEIASALLGFDDHYTSGQFIPIDWKGFDLWVCFATTNYKAHTYTRAFKHSKHFHLIVNQSDKINQHTPLETFTQTHSFVDDYLYRDQRLEHLSVSQFFSQYYFTKNHRTLDDSKLHQFTRTHSLAGKNGTGYLKRTVKVFPTLPFFNTTSSAHGVGTEAFCRIMCTLFIPFRSFADIIGDAADFTERLDNLEKGLFSINENDFRMIKNWKRLGSEEKGSITYKLADRNMVFAPEIFNPLHQSQADLSRSFETDQPETEIYQYHLPDKNEYELRHRHVMGYLEFNNVYDEQNDLNKSRKYVGETPKVSAIIEKMSIQFMTDQENSFIEHVKLIRNRHPAPNATQWKLIKLFGMHFIDLHRAENNPDYVYSPLRVILHGEGGTGKSFCINIISEMAKKIGHPEWVLKSAYAGKAAVGIGGDTIDSLYSFTREKESHNSDVQPFVKAAKIHILDEVSMIPQQRLHQLHLKLGRNAGDATFDHLFGNRSVLLAGDFVQLPPVKACSVLKGWAANDNSPNVTKGSAMTIAILRKITHYFELTRNQRQQDDAAYLQVLRNIRNRQVTERDYEYLKLHCSVRPEEMDDDWFLTTTFIVSDNMQRIRWNHEIIQRFSRVNHTPVYTLFSKDDVNMASHLITSSILNILYESTASLLQSSLKLAVGMPILFTQNDFKHLRVCNGSEGTLRGFIFDEFNAIKALKIEVNPPIPFHLDGLDPNTIIIKRSRREGHFKLKAESFDYVRTQFPIQEGFCWTAHKAQGCTLNKAAVWLDDNGQTSYVKLSRTKSSASTFILPNFSINSLTITRNEDYEAWRKTLAEGILHTNEAIDRIIAFN